MEIKKGFTFAAGWEPSEEEEEEIDANKKCKILNRCFTLQV